MRLSPAQRRALGKLTSPWQTARELGERRVTLDALVERRLANRSGLGLSGDAFLLALDGRRNRYRITPLGTRTLTELP